MNNRFDAPVLMESYCALASSGTGFIHNKIIFTHSMANNIFAAALREKMCHFTNDTSSWYLCAPPSIGSLSADFVNQLCTEPMWRDGAIHALAVKLHYCKNDNATGVANPAYVSLMTTDPSIQGLVQYMTPYASGVMCGTSLFGLLSEYSLGLEAVAKFTGFKEPNDGMVGISECTAVAPIEWFSTDASNRFYLAEINHADATGRNGNGIVGHDRQPLAWFSQRT